MAIKVANNQSMTGITALPSAISGGAWTLISTTTASSSATLDITSGLDDTYDVYCFKYYNLHLATDGQDVLFNGSDDTSSHSYNITKTTSYFYARHDEGDSATQLTYLTGLDLAQGTGFQPIAKAIGNGNDESCSGELYLYAPSDTTFVKHFIGRTVGYNGGDEAQDNYFAGYFNTTAAITALQFKAESGNIDAGVIKLYGIS
jgi:hypothetical protein